MKKNIIIKKNKIMNTSKFMNLNKIGKIILFFCILIGLLLFYKWVPLAENLKLVKVNGNMVKQSKVDSLDFVHVKGINLITSTGNKYRMKGIAFGNNVWYNPQTAPITHHDEGSYKEIANLGFNTVRFYINYGLFEDDDKPYKYKKSGFDWIDKNIKWAKKYGIRLVINMHVPQGGFISTSNVSIWQSENMERYRHLWGAITERYKNEPTILGYGLMNEPYMPYYENASDALDLYFDFMNDTIELIRTKDKNHILFIERPYGCVNATTKSVTYPWGEMGSFQTVKDKNVVYEYHFYDKFEFTSQKLSWIKSFRDWYYNEDTRIILTGNREWKKQLDFNSIRIKYNKKIEWNSITSSKMQIKNGGNAGYWYLTVINSDKTNEINIDDIVIKEYDQKGKYIRDVYKYDFTNATYCDGWDINTNGGQYSYDSKSGSKAPGSAKISKVGDRYKIYISYNDNNFFPVQNGYYYQLTAKVKMTNSDIVLIPGIQMHKIEKLYRLNIEYLEYSLDKFREWSITNNVPIYLGEFGVTRHIIGNSYKGEEWVRDMLLLLNKYDMNYNYHDYHEENYGLYEEDGRVERKIINKTLYKVFESEVKKN